MNTVNYIGLSPNISRIFEICKSGNFTIHLYSEKNTKQDCLNFLNFYGLQNTNMPDADIVAELCFDPADIAKTFRTESLEDILLRIKNCPGPETITDNSLNESGELLLKRAVEKLSLTISDVETIKKVAQTIARLSFSDSIKVEHIAEAIHYKCLKNEKTILFDNIAESVLKSIDLKTVTAEQLKAAIIDELSCRLS